MGDTLAARGRRCARRSYLRGRVRLRAGEAGWGRGSGDKPATIASAAIAKDERPPAGRRRGVDGRDGLREGKAQFGPPSKKRLPPTDRGGLDGGDGEARNHGLPRQPMRAQRACPASAASPPPTGTVGPGCP